MYLLPPNQRKRESYSLRLLLFQVVVMLSFVVMAARLYQIQFLQRGQFVAEADENRFDQISVPATRGIITDRNGMPLAVNAASANVTVTPALLPSDPGEELAALERLAGLLGIQLSGEVNGVDERGIPLKSLVEMVTEGEGIAPFRPVVVKSDVDHDIARLILADRESFPGVDVEWLSVREYPSGALTAHVVGYTGPIPESLADEYEANGYVLDRDRIGYDGIEFALEDLLAGSPGIQTVERDVAGAIVRTVGDVRPPQAGYNVELTIDIELQQRGQELILETLENMRALYPDDLIGFDRGVVIALNPRTGEILALVSWPTYDNSRFARNIDYPYYLQVSQDPEQPLFNQAISSLYPPGSIFKMITLAGALEEGVITPDQIITDPGPIRLQNRYYPNDPGAEQEFVCWIHRAGESHGDVDAILSLAYSCDIYYYKIGGGYPGEVDGIGLGIERLAKWMSIFGLGNFTGVELAGEIDGVIPDPTWKRRVWGENWSTGDTYNSAFGQGYVLSTPLQMAYMTSIIANNGTPVRPTLVRRISDQEGNIVQDFVPEFRDPIPVSPETMRILQEGMREAIINEEGTARFANQYISYVPVAGKTGTAEFCDNIAAALERCIPGAWPAHAWYVTYAPYGNPEIAVVAFIYNGLEGATVALPVASNMLDTYFTLKAERAIEAQQGGETPAAPTASPPPGDDATEPVVSSAVPTP